VNDEFHSYKLWQELAFYLISNLQHKNTAIKWNKMYLMLQLLKKPSLFESVSENVF